MLASLSSLREISAEPAGSSHHRVSLLKQLVVFHFPLKRHATLLLNIVYVFGSTHALDTRTHLSSGGTISDLVMFFSALVSLASSLSEFETPRGEKRPLPKKN